MISWLFTFSLLLILSLTVYLIRQTGILNLATEGLFIWSVFSAFYFFSVGADFWLTWIGVIFSAGTFFLFFYFLRFILAINENFAGMIINFLSFSLLDFINTQVYGRQGVLYFQNPIVDLPLFRWIMVLIALLCFFFVAYILFKTSLGLRLRLIFSPDEKKQERGLSVHTDRFILFVLSTVLLALSAMALLISLNAYTVGLGSGFGWMSLFSLLLAGRSMLGILGSSAFLAGVLGFSYYAQETIGFYFSASLPYFISFIAYLGVCWWQNGHKER